MSTATASRLDLDFVRRQFPAFAEPDLQGHAFFENAGGSYACRQVIERLDNYYRRLKVQPYYPYPASDAAGAAMDESYTALAAYLDVAPDEVHVGPSTSQNTYVLAQAALGFLRPGDEIVVTDQDHEGNSGVWRRLAERDITVREWRVDADTGELHAEQLAALLSDKTRLVAYPHCSNILGQINPVADYARLAHEVGAITVVDGVSFAGHGLPDVPSLGADIYLFSSYKTYGPHQGVMTVRRAVAKRLSNQGHYFNADAPQKRLNPAGPDHAQVAALAGVTQYFDALCAYHYGDDPLSDAERAQRVRDLLHDAETARLAPLLEFLDAHPKIRIVGPAVIKNRAPTVSVVIDGHDPGELVVELGRRGIMSGSGHFYAARLLDAMGIANATGVTRFSFVHYTDDSDIEALIAALDSIV